MGKEEEGNSKDLQDEVFFCAYLALCISRSSSVYCIFFRVKGGNWAKQVKRRERGKEEKIERE